MKNNESFNKKCLYPILKLKNVDLYRNISLKKKPSRNIFFDAKRLSKNNENTLIISDASINIFYKNNKTNLENEIKNKEPFIYNKYLNKTNYYSVSNKKTTYDSFSQGSSHKYLLERYRNKLPKLKKYSSMKLKLIDFWRDKEENKKINLEYKKRLKKINSSFYPDSYYSPEKKRLDNSSSKNILYDSSVFTSNKKISLKKYKLTKNKSFNEKKVNFNGIIAPNRNIYQFILDPLPNGKIYNIKKISEKLKKMENKMEKILENDNNKIFTNAYSIIDKNKFRKEFQNLFIYDNKHEQKEKYKNLINPEVYKEHSLLLKEVREEANKNNKYKKIFNGFREIVIKKIINKKYLIEKFKFLIIRISQFLKNRKIKKEEINKYKLIKQSFTYKLTKTFIDSIKLKNYDLCCSIIERNKYIVLDFDYFYLTPLHWAVKKNFYEFIPKLLDYGSIVDSINFSGDSPLHIAVKKNYYDSACILLYYSASPFIKDRDGKKPIEISNNFYMKSLLEKIMKIHYLSYFQRTINQENYIRSKLWIFIKEVFKNKISTFVFNFFKALNSV